MKIFITYKGQDIDKVVETIEKFREISPDVQISIIRNSKRWKAIARKYIKNSDLVIYLAGYEYSENIDWEINTAIKIGHRVHCIKLYDDIVLEERLCISDKFDNMHRVLKIEPPVTLDEMIDRIRGDRSYLHDKLFSSNITDTPTLIEQYKMMLSTSESLIERRQKLTTTYLSIFSALLPVITLMLSFKSSFLNIGIIIISGICIILCISWRSSIVSYGKSNNAKFAILEEIEKKLPAAIFASEWIALKRITSQYKSFTSRETVIPLLFIFVYIVFAVIAIALCFGA